MALLTRLKETAQVLRQRMRGARVTGHVIGETQQSEAFRRAPPLKALPLVASGLALLIGVALHVSSTTSEQEFRIAGLIIAILFICFTIAKIAAVGSDVD